MNDFANDVGWVVIAFFAAFLLGLFCFWLGGDLLINGNWECTKPKIIDGSTLRCDQYTRMTAK